MLANSAYIPAPSGQLSKDVHLPATSRWEMLDFIAGELPHWRDKADRPAATSETALTEQLCDYLNGAARRSEGWDFLQFRTEVGDERNKGRKIDLVPKPCNSTVWIEGRRFTEFETLLPIECKRFPIPKEKDRDEREYVVSRFSSTGGIQRFKAGHHGSTHAVAGMIGYLQEGSADHWVAQVTGWIYDLVGAKQSGWTQQDLPILEREDKHQRTAVLRSKHTRERDLPDIEMRHLWVQLN